MKKKVASKQTKDIAMSRYLKTLSLLNSTDNKMVEKDRRDKRLIRIQKIKLRQEIEQEVNMSLNYLVKRKVLCVSADNYITKYKKGI